jgi:hypothetical protein
MFGVYYTVTREGKIFAGLSDELMWQSDNQDFAIKYCEGLNIGGYLDELHSGYVVKKL